MDVKSGTVFSRLREVRGCRRKDGLTVIGLTRDGHRSYFTRSRLLYAVRNDIPVDGIPSYIFIKQDVDGRLRVATPHENWADMHAVKQNRKRENDLILKRAI